MASACVKGTVRGHSADFFVIGDLVQKVWQDRAATIPAVCRKGSLNGTLIDKQNWIAASEKTGGRPGCPSCGASHAISLSSQISSEPRLRSAALSLNQFVLR